MLSMYIRKIRDGVGSMSTQIFKAAWSIAVKHMIKKKLEEVCIKSSFGLLLLTCRWNLSGERQPHQRVSILMWIFRPLRSHFLTMWLQEYIDVMVKWKDTISLVASKNVIFTHAVCMQACKYNWPAPVKIFLWDLPPPTHPPTPDLEPMESFPPNKLENTMYTHCIVTIKENKNVSFTCFGPLFFFLFPPKHKFCMNKAATDFWGTGFRSGMLNRLQSNWMKKTKKLLKLLSWSQFLFLSLLWRKLKQSEW